jgi:hypothetical protein
MKRLVTTALVVVLLGLAGLARAEDKKSATGTWKWTVERNGNEFHITLKLKQEGDKLTGTIDRDGQNEVKIDDGKIKDNEVTFKVEREVNGNKFTIKYKGKLEGDAIKGKSEIERDGNAMSFDWEAKRSRD